MMGAGSHLLGCTEKNPNSKTIKMVFFPAPTFFFLDPYTFEIPELSLIILSDSEIGIL